MPRPKDMPADLATPQKRIEWWARHRGIDRPELAKNAGMKYSTLTDYLYGRSKTTRFLHRIASALGLRPEYLETGRGEPEAEYPAEPIHDPWPFAHVTKGRIERLNTIERRYAEDRLQDALAEIEAERRKTKRTG